jgi:hypothetical protein
MGGGGGGLKTTRFGRVLRPKPTSSKTIWTKQPLGLTKYALTTHDAKRAESKWEVGYQQVYYILLFELGVVLCIRRPGNKDVVNMR